VVNAIQPPLHDGDRIAAEKAVHAAGFRRLEGGERRALVDVIVSAEIATRDTRAVAAAVLGAAVVLPGEVLDIVDVVEVLPVVMATFSTSTWRELKVFGT